MKLNNFWVAILFLFLSCQFSTEVNLKNTKLIDGVYCYKNGKALNGYMRLMLAESVYDFSRTWDEVHFVDGVPTGRYKKYESDYFTSIGTFKVIKMASNSPIRRISIQSDSLLYHSTRVTAYIIVKNKIIIADTSLYYKALEKHKLNIAEKIDHMVISTGEYESSSVDKTFNLKH